MHRAKRFKGLDNSGSAESLSQVRLNRMVKRNACRKLRLARSKRPQEGARSPKTYALLSLPSEDRISASELVVPFVPHTRVVILATLVGLFFAGSAPAIAANEVVAGDSLGVGIAMASGFENRAANSVAIRGNRAIDQLRKIRPGSTVYMSLGTNDAVGSVKGIEKSIDAIVQTANASRLKLVWIGPPCVIKPWDKNAAELDGILHQRLAGTGVTYVSMRDQSLCSSSVRGKDGVHFTMEGYRAIWSKTAAATGYQVASLSRETTQTPAAKKKQRRDEATAQPQETPRVRTTVTSASFVPLPLPAAAPSNKKRGSIAGEYFSFGFRWPDTVRSSGHYFPAD
jgi:hypothetical protein